MRGQITNTNVVTTCSLEGWQRYGQRMVETFIQFWPREVLLTVYVENFSAPVAPNVRAADFPQWFVDWKKRHLYDKGAHGLDVRFNRRGRPYDFRRDCVKFAHKVAAFTDHALRLDRGLLIWMDADMLTHDRVTEEWLESYLRPAPDGPYMGWLDRSRLYPECGFLLFNCAHPRHHEFMNSLLDIYRSDRVFELSETHDSFVIEKVARAAVKVGWFPEPVSLSGTARGYHHPLPHSELGSRLDHAKGARKSHGRTPSHEVNRREAHWSV